MHKKVLSEIDTYFGTVDMPKYFEINRSELKSSLLSSVVEDKCFKNSFVISNPFDYEMLNGKAFTMLNTYLIENFRLKHGVTLINDFNFGNIFNLCINTSAIYPTINVNIKYLMVSILFSGNVLPYNILNIFIIIITIMITVIVAYNAALNVDLFLK